MSEKTKLIEVNYDKSKDYRTVSAQGAYGGVTPAGDIIAHFFIEHEQVPDGVKLIVDEDGKRKGEKKITEELILTRELQIGVVMNPHIAQVIGNWLIKKSEMLLKSK